MKMRFLHRIVILMFCGLASSSWSQSNSLPKIPLPSLPTGTIELRVAHVINPRLNRMSDAQIAVMLEQITRTAQEHFGLHISFSKPVQVPIEKVFASMPRKFSALAHRYTYNPQSLFQRSSRLHEAFAKGLALTGEPFEAQSAFAARHAPNIQAKDFDQLGQALAKLQLANIARWSERRSLDGNSVLDGSDFHKFLMWNHLGYGDLPYEFVITNQIIASVELVLPSVHSAIRGGYTNGITSYNRQSKFGTYSAWSTFAFSENDAQWLEWRDGEHYSADEAARLAGIAAVHELGHQLLHLLHPFGQKGCIMEPVPMFAYRAWAQQLSATECPLHSSKAMTPGSYAFHFQPP